MSTREEENRYVTRYMLRILACCVIAAPFVVLFGNAAHSEHFLTGKPYVEILGRGALVVLGGIGFMALMFWAVWYLNGGAENQ